MKRTNVISGDGSFRLGAVGDSECKQGPGMEPGFSVSIPGLLFASCVASGRTCLTFEL